MSHRGDLTARMVELQLMLAERPRSQRELIEHFDVDRKTVKRAIDALSLHYQISEEQDGREVRYSFSDGYEFVPPTLTPGEVATLVLSQESIAATGLSDHDSPFAGHARRLMMKVRAALPVALRDKLDALAGVYGTAAVPAKNFAGHAKTIELLTEAAVARRQVHLLYYSLTDGRTKERVVEPYNVYFDPDGATLKLVGYDHLRRQVVPFSVDHIRELRVTEQPFERPADFELRAYLLENCFNGIHGAPVDVVLRVRGTTARIFRERTFHPSQCVVDDGGDATSDTVTVRMRVAGGRGLVRFILSWAPDVEVLTPPELRLEVVEAHRRALAALAAEK